MGTEEERKGCSEYSVFTVRNKQHDTAFGRRLQRDAKGICNRVSRDLESAVLVFSCG